MESSAEKTTDDKQHKWHPAGAQGEMAETVTSFRYLRAVVSDDGSKPESLFRIVQATACLTKLKPVWRDNNTSLGSKVKLMYSLIISIFQGL